MRKLNRRRVLGEAGAAAAAVGLAGAFGAGSARAAELTGDFEGPVHDQGGELFNVASAAYGAVGDCIQGTNGSINNGSTTFNASGHSFPSTLVGATITVAGAGTSGAVLVTTVAAVPSTSQLTLTAAASASVSGANFAVGTENTAAFQAALTAAGSTGRLFLPAGLFLITGAANSGAPISLSSSGGMLGAGGVGINPSQPNSVIVCGDETAGIVITGCGAYESFECDGNGVANYPLRIGSVDGSNVAQGDCVGASFLDVWARGSAKSGFTIYGAQKCTFIDCRSRFNTLDGYEIDGGAGDLHFWHHHETDNLRHGIHGDNQIQGNASTTYYDHCEEVRFYSGICDSSGTGYLGVTKITLAATVNWTFRAVVVSGSGDTSGSAVVIDQSKGGYGTEFAECWFGHPYSNGPGLPDIEITGTTGGDSSHAFLIVNGAQWYTGSNSVVLDNATNSFFIARDWFNQNKATQGPDGKPASIDAFLRGREGGWVNEPLSGWSGGVSYRVNSDGTVQFKGAATKTGSSTLICTLRPGYRPAATLTLPATKSGSAANSYITVGTDGSVNADSAVASLGQIFLDGISFPVR